MLQSLFKLAILLVMMNIFSEITDPTFAEILVDDAGMQTSIWNIASNPNVQK